MQRKKKERERKWDSMHKEDGVKSVTSVFRYFTVSGRLLLEPRITMTHRWLHLSSEIHAFIRKHQVFPHLNFNILGWESMTFGQVTEEAGVISFAPYAAFLDKSTSLGAVSVNPLGCFPLQEFTMLSLVLHKSHTFSFLFSALLMVKKLLWCMFSNRL